MLQVNGSADNLKPNLGHSRALNAGWSGEPHN